MALAMKTSGLGLVHVMLSRAHPRLLVMLPNVMIHQQTIHLEMALLHSVD